MGFATLENLIYVFSSLLADISGVSVLSAFATGIFRMLLSIPLHFSCACIMGLFYGKAKYLKSLNKNFRSKVCLALSVILPMFGHGLYDFGLFETSFLGLSFLTAFVLDIIAIVIFIKTKKKNRQIISENIGELYEQKENF